MKQYFIKRAIIWSFVKGLLAAIVTFSLLGKVSTSFAYLSYYSQSSTQIFLTPSEWAETVSELTFSGLSTDVLSDLSQKLVLKPFFILFFDVQKSEPVSVTGFLWWICPPLISGLSFLSLLVRRTPTARCHHCYAHS